jgi:hypothetical protein
MPSLSYIILLFWFFIVTICSIIYINDKIIFDNKQIMKKHFNIWCEENNMKQMKYYERARQSFHTMCDILYPDQEYLKSILKQSIDTSWDYQEKECLVLNDDEIYNSIIKTPRSMKKIDHLKHNWIIKNYIYN